MKLVSPKTRHEEKSPSLLALMFIFISLNLFAEKNLIKNGSFDEGAESAAYWELADGLTSFYVMEEGHGRVVKMDTCVDRKQALDWYKAFKADPSRKPPLKTPIAATSYGSIGGNEGVMLDSDFIECKPGQDYKLTADFKGVGIPFVWIKGFLWHPTRETWVDGYQTRLAPDTASTSEWHTASIGFNPTAKSPRIRKFKIRLYAYWPNGLYYFDNIRIEEITPEEMAQLIAKRGEVN